MIWNFCLVNLLPVYYLPPPQTSSDHRHRRCCMSDNRNQASSGVYKMIDLIQTWYQAFLPPIKNFIDYGERQTSDFYPRTNCELVKVNINYRPGWRRLSSTLLDFCNSYCYFDGHYCAILSDNISNKNQVLDWF